MGGWGGYTSEDIQRYNVLEKVGAAIITLAAQNSVLTGIGIGTILGVSVSWFSAPVDIVSETFWQQDSTTSSSTLRVTRVKGES
jgi:hypothetical protein